MTSFIPSSSAAELCCRYWAVRLNDLEARYGCRPTSASPETTEQDPSYTFHPWMVEIEMDDEMDHGEDGRWDQG
ncbi:hypothetical protein E4U23_003490 [Claviceps purpurea]|nr:hypothetical protein E4U37_002024 [Claviceps purpurea]KAG6171851.1 hypothetical protein E4U51_008158 [Claviceps purpurea]KAG6228379.1 hypothetical protein E4U26_001052 [Claviceps purpurea]KAG6247789.1 hypothetical protein E4U23_003490 [Claviceps purpurea]